MIAESFTIGKNYDLPGLTYYVNLLILPYGTITCHQCL
jgi:hypothetical protein